MKIVAIIFVVWLLAGLLFGCASVDDRPYARCTANYTRDAGMGASLPACSAWQFGDISRTVTPMAKPWWQ